MAALTEAFVEGESDVFIGEVSRGRSMAALADACDGERVAVRRFHRERVVVRRVLWRAGERMLEVVDDESSRVSGRDTKIRRDRVLVLVEESLKLATGERSRCLGCSRLVTHVARFDVDIVSRDNGEMTTHVTIEDADLKRFEPVVGPEAVAQGEALAARLRKKLNGHAVWNVNSTAVGGGVAEMLPSLLGYARKLGIDARWTVIEAEPPFFRLTKRLHHALHGSSGDGFPLDEAAHALYEAQLEPNIQALRAEVRPGDVVILHDPQTAGLAPALIEHGAHVLWRCHIGHDAQGPDVSAGWSFLLRYLERVPTLIFSRDAYAPSSIDRSRVVVIQPSIDAFSPKNQGMSREATLAILDRVGLIRDDAANPQACGFMHADGTKGRVDRGADLVHAGPAPSKDVPLVVQVSRWDPLKDMAGVMRGFSTMLQSDENIDAHLVLAGPRVTAVADDPEGPAVYQEVVRAWQGLPQAVRERVTLAMLPTDDVAENAAMVNALQRHAAIVVQKSLHEGFGLTVTEAMWKGRTVVASRVGGIQDQIEDGKSGVLIDDPTDLDAFARVLRELLMDPARMDAIGQGAAERVRQQFLGLRHVSQYAALIEALLDAA